MAFFVNAVKFLKTNGELIAILPLGVLTSERDEQAWEVLKKLGEIEVVKYNGDNVFCKATVHTAIVKFTRKRPKQKKQRTNIAQKAEIINKSTCNYKSYLQLIVVKSA